VELFIIRVKFAIYYFLHFNKVCKVAARLRAKSAIYDCLVLNFKLIWTDSIKGQLVTDTEPPVQPKLLTCFWPMTHDDPLFLRQLFVATKSIEHDQVSY